MQFFRFKTFASYELSSYLFGTPPFAEVLVNPRLEVVVGFDELWLRIEVEPKADEPSQCETGKSPESIRYAVSEWLCRS
jgi:hypothetical protein